MLITCISLLLAASSGQLYSYSGTGACPAHQFETASNRASAPSCSQPQESDIAGWPMCGTDGVLSSPAGGVPACVTSVLSARQVPQTGVTGLPICGGALTTMAFDGGLGSGGTFITCESSVVNSVEATRPLENDGDDQAASLILQNCPVNQVWVNSPDAGGGFLCEEPVSISHDSVCATNQIPRSHIIGESGHYWFCDYDDTASVVPATGAGISVTSPGTSFGNTEYDVGLAACVSTGQFPVYNATAGTWGCTANALTATTCSALAGTTQCSAGSAPTGIDTSGTVQNCTAYLTSAVLPVSGSNGGFGGAQPTCTGTQNLTCSGSTCSCVGGRQCSILASDQILGVSPVALPGMTFTAAAGASVHIDCDLKVITQGANNGPRFSVILSQTGSADVDVLVRQLITTGTSITWGNLQSSGTYTTGITSGITTGTNLMWGLTGAILNGNGGSGTITVWGGGSYTGAADAGAGNALYVKRGSACCWEF